MAKKKSLLSVLKKEMHPRLEVGFIIFGAIVVLMLICAIFAVGDISALTFKNQQREYSFPLQNHAQLTPAPTPIIAPTNYFIEASTSIPNWKIFRCRDYEISFPNNYSISGTGCIIHIWIVDPKLDHPGRPLQKDEMKIDIGIHPKGFKSLDEIYNDHLKLLDSEDSLARLTEVKLTILNNYDAVYSTFFDGEQYEFFHNNEHFHIIKFPLITTKQEDFQAILSTFKFTN